MAFTTSSVRTLQASVTRRHASNRCLSGVASRAGLQCTCSADSGLCAKHARRNQSIVPRASASVGAASTETAAEHVYSVDEIVQANKRFQKTFNCDLPAPPARKVAIVTCMDARIHPEEVMGFDVGDAHVIRNAGGRISIDALRSLVISQRMLGTQEVLVIHHTQCGMATLQNDAVYKKVEEEVGQAAKDIIDGFDFMPLIGDLEECVRQDVKLVKECAAVPDSIPVHGFIYDVQTGALNPVSEAK